MTLAETVAAMVAAGCTAEQIKVVVESVDEQRRAKAREGNRRRQAELRERKRNGNNAVTGRDRALHAVTGRDEALRADEPRAPAFFIGEDSTIPPVEPNGSTAPKGADDAKRGVRIPEDWKPSADDRKYGFGLGLTEGQIGLVAEEFVNYWLSRPGSGARKLSWSRTFKARLAEKAPQLKAFEKRTGRNGTEPKRTVHDAARDLHETVLAALAEPKPAPVLSLADRRERGGEAPDGRLPEGRC